MTRAEYSLSGYLNLCNNVWWKHFCPSICCQSYLCKSRGHCLGLSVLHISIEYRWSEFITKWFLFADRPHAWLLGLQSTNQIHFKFRRYELTTHAISDLCIIVEINVLHNFYIPLEQCLRWRNLPLESDPDGTQVWFGQDSGWNLSTHWCETKNARPMASSKSTTALSLSSSFETTEIYRIIPLYPKLGSIATPKICEIII